MKILPGFFWIKHLKYCCLLLLILPVSNCKNSFVKDATTPAILFNEPVRVNIQGYNGNVMEPFISRDGNTLLFNNLNSPPENTNLHWATKINDTTFKYNGEIAGVNTADLEGVATMDAAGNLYFVSNRNYVNTLATLYQCNFLNGTATNVKIINGISRLQPGWVNFDVEVSANGQTLYFTDAHFNSSGNPETADLIIANKNDSGFTRQANSNEILKNINTDALEYAACISVNELELYFTRVPVIPNTLSIPQIFVSTRQNKNEAFNTPSLIKNIIGFAEAPTIAPDQKTLYFHKKENDKFVLYKIIKK